MSLLFFGSRYIASTASPHLDAGLVASHPLSQLKALVKVPVVLCSPLRAGKISEVVARLFLDVGAGVAGSLKDNGVQDQGGEGRSFQIPYESTMND